MTWTTTLAKVPGTGIVPACILPLTITMPNLQCQGFTGETRIYSNADKYPPWLAIKTIGHTRIPTWRGRTTEIRLLTHNIPIILILWVAINGATDELF